MLKSRFTHRRMKSLAFHLVGYGIIIGLPLGLVFQLRADQRQVFADMDARQAQEDAMQEMNTAQIKASTTQWVQSLHKSQPSSKHVTPKKTKLEIDLENEAGPDDVLPPSKQLKH